MTLSLVSENTGVVVLNSVGMVKITVTLGDDLINIAL